MRLQIEVLSKERIDSYIHNKEEEARNPKPSPAPTRDAEDSKAAPTASSRDSRASQQVCSSVWLLAVLTGIFIRVIVCMPFSGSGPRKVVLLTIQFESSGFSSAEGQQQEAGS